MASRKRNSRYSFTKRRKNIRKKKMKRTKRTKRTLQYGGKGTFLLPHQLIVGKFYTQFSCSNHNAEKTNFYGINTCEGEMQEGKKHIQFMGVYVEEILPSHTNVLSYTEHSYSGNHDYYLYENQTKLKEPAPFVEEVAKKLGSKYYVVILKFRRFYRDGTTKNYFCNSSTSNIFKPNKTQLDPKDNNNLKMFIGVIYAKIYNENKEYVGQLIKTFENNEAIIKDIIAKLDCHKETGNNCYNWYVTTNTQDLNVEPKSDYKKYEPEPEYEDEREVDLDALTDEQRERRLRKFIDENDPDDDDDDDFTPFVIKNTNIPRAYGPAYTVGKWGLKLNLY